MAAILINISIDAPDPVRFENNKYPPTEDLSINQIESISEWVLEGLLHINNAVPETGDDDSAVVVKHIATYYFIHNYVMPVLIPPGVTLHFKAIHIFIASLWECDIVNVLTKPPRL